MFELALIVPAFVAGVLMFLAPCTLPVIPGYLAFISGIPGTALADPRKVKGKIIRNALFFIFGFTVIFVALGILAGSLGGLLGPYRYALARVGGILIIFFGLMLLGVLHTPTFFRERHIKLPSYLTLGKPQSSFLVGALFALGWSPCIGPLLGTLLLLASSSATAFTGALLLLVFSLGLGLPMLLTALLIGEAGNFLMRVSLFGKSIAVLGGLFLIGIGVLMVLGNYTLLITYGYRL
ncbi:MAG TPA: cytochrome c biogenesis protein CcdA, partial [Candidatus Paceibacterota bacterium]